MNFNKDTATVSTREVQMIDIHVDLPTETMRLFKDAYDYPVDKEIRLFINGYPVSKSTVQSLQREASRNV